MGLEQATEALESDLSGTQGTETSGDQGQAAAPFELDTAQTIRFKGKDYTPAQFEKAMMFQSDYTKKSQALAEERKYYDNLSHDLEAVKGDPKLAMQFMKIYPEKFHAYLKQVMPSDWSTKQQGQGEQLPPEFQSKLERFENYIREQEVGKQEAQIDQITSKLAQKYPEAIEDVVLARAQALVEQGHELTQEHWEKLYKTSNDFMVKKLQDYNNKKFSAVKDNNLRGRGMGPGGGTPGQAPRKLSFKDATEAAIQDLGGKR